MNRWYWDYTHLTEPFAYGPDTTYEAAAKFLDGGPVEDWGCGTCYAKKFFPKGYIGIDAAGPFADRIMTLPPPPQKIYNVHGILLRHVLEHNSDWEYILERAVQCSQKLVVIIFTPFSQKTHVIGSSSKEGCASVPDFSFCKQDLTGFFPRWTEESFETGIAYGKETVFYVTT